MVESNARARIRSKVEVRGRVQLGRVLKLAETGAEPEASGPTWNPGRIPGNWLPEHEQLPSSGSTSLRRERVHNEFRETEQELFFSDQGLCESYGIFGSPGVGKTYLLRHLWRQLLALNKEDPDKKFGAMILDPKAALIEDVKQDMAQIGRAGDLVIINTQELKRAGATLNVIDTFLGPWDLGKALVLAARSAGVGASDPYWFQTWADLFGATLYMLKVRDPDGQYTLKQLMDTVLGSKQEPELLGVPGERKPRLKLLAEEVSAKSDLPESERADLDIALDAVDRYLHDEENRNTIANFIQNGYGLFRQSQYGIYSDEAKVDAETNFYDRILEKGKVVLVSVAPSEYNLSTVLCTLMKSLFQQAMISRYERYYAGSLQNFDRPVMLVADEYSRVASEVEGQPMGDAQYFSLSRQNGGMNLIATQSIHMLQNSSLKDAWRAVFSNFAAKVFMRVGDNESAEEASKLAGETDWYMWSESLGTSKEGLSGGTQQDFREKKELATQIVTQRLKKGDAVVIGSLDSGETEPGTYFIHVDGRRATH